MIVHKVNSRDEFAQNIKSTKAIENNSGKAEITVVNIQKFKDDPAVVRNTDYNLNLQRVYFLDEVHRSYNPKGSFLANLRESDPNAIKIGLTGTPLLGDDYNSKLLFLDSTNKKDVILINATNLGTKIKDGKNQKTVLSEDDQQQIIDTFNNKDVMEDFSVVVDYEEIKSKNYSMSAGQYFEVKIEYTDITQVEFKAKMTAFEKNLDDLFAQSKDLEKEIKQNLKGLNFGSN